MGNVLATATRLIDNEKSELADFRRALVEEQSAFDAVFRAAHRRVQAMLFSAPHLLTFEAILLAKSIEDDGRIEQLEQQIIRLERMVRALSGDNRTDNQLMDISQWMSEQNDDETKRLDHRRLLLSRGNDGMAD